MATTTAKKSVGQRVAAGAKKAVSTLFGIDAARQAWSNFRAALESGDAAKISAAAGPLGLRREQVELAKLVYRAYEKLDGLEERQAGAELCVKRATRLLNVLRRASAGSAKDADEIAAKIEETENALLDANRDLSRAKSADSRRNGLVSVTPQVFGFSIDGDSGLPYGHIPETIQAFMRQKLGLEPLIDSWLDFGRQVPRNKRRRIVASEFK